MSEDKSYHMTPDEFRRRGREAVDWIADYMERLEEFPVQSQVAPGDIFNALPAEAPESGEPFEAVLRDMSELIMPGITHWQSPNFFAYFPANGSGPGILGDLVSSGLGVQGMIWATSPACTELETRVMDWLVGMLDLPERFRSDGKGGGVIQDTASGAAVVALVAARERATNLETNRTGVRVPLTAYVSTQTHSSLEKAVRIAGIGTDNLRAVDVDSTYAMRPESLRAAIEADVAAGRKPFFACATIGTTSSNAIDPVREIAAICREHGIWLHIDAAMAGTAALCPEFRWTNDGVEAADSYCFNPHKWMFTNFDCDCFWVADRAALINALTILPEYPAQQGDRVGRGDRLPRLAAGAGATLPRPQALVRDPPLRRRGTAPPRAAPRRDRPGVRLVGARRRALRACGRAAAQPRLLPPPRRRRGQPAHHGRHQRVGGDLLHPHQAGRQADAAHVDRRRAHGALATSSGPGG